MSRLFNAGGSLFCTAWRESRLFASGALRVRRQHEVSEAMSEVSVMPDAQAKGSLPEDRAGAKIEEPGDPAEYLGSLDAPEETTGAEQKPADPDEVPETKPEPEDTGVSDEGDPVPKDGEDLPEDPEADDALSGRVQKRISKLTARWHEAEEKAEAATQRAAVLEKQVATNLGVHPMFLSAEEATVIEQVNKLEAQQEQLFTRLDGYDDEMDPSKSMTAEQVRREYVRVQRLLSDLKPKAMLAYDRANADQLEALRLGRALLREQRQKRPAVRKPAAVKPSPKLPAAPSVAPGSAVSVNQRGPSEERFKSAGGTEEALHAELSMI